MVESLVRGGFDVGAYDLDPAALTAAAALGAAAASSSSG
jgi:3-hydroxyisobutyrate dehydrogenase-like beta-hydroxyacid dehydrogenase